MYFFENPSDATLKETYGFKTHRNAPQSKSLTNFEHDLAHLIASLEYSDHMTPFQKQLAKDVRTIQKSDKIYVSADKTSNTYMLDKNDYNKLMRDSVTAHYVKTDANTESSINLECYPIHSAIN